MQETRAWSLGQEDPLEKEMSTHSRTLAWKIPWTEEPGRLQSMGPQRVRHDWATELNWTEGIITHTHIHTCIWMYTCEWVCMCIHLCACMYTYWASLVAQRLKRLPPTRETWVRSLGQEDPLEKEMATHSSTLTWRILWTEEPGGLQSTGSQRVGHNWVTKQQQCNI